MNSSTLLSRPALSTTSASIFLMGSVEGEGVVSLMICSGASALGVASSTEGEMPKLGTRFCRLKLKTE